MERDDAVDAPDGERAIGLRGDLRTRRSGNQGGRGHSSARWRLVLFERLVRVLADLYGAAWKVKEEKLMDLPGLEKLDPETRAKLEQAMRSGPDAALDFLIEYTKSAKDVLEGQTAEMVKMWPKLQERIEIVRAKIRSDAMYLKWLVDSQALKPDWEARVMVRVAETHRDYAFCFEEEGEAANEADAGPTDDTDERNRGVQADSENL